MKSKHIYILGLLLILLNACREDEHIVVTEYQIISDDVNPDSAVERLKAGLTQ